MIKEGSFVWVNQTRVVARVRGRSLDSENLELEIVGGGDGTDYPFLYNKGSLIFRCVEELTEITGTEDQVRAALHLLGAV